jgi:hypothetical protein
MTVETIDHTTLSRLVEAGAVRGAHVIGQQGGWALIVKYGMTERPLAAQRSRQVRMFRKLETLVSYLKDVGIGRFDVDAINYGPDSPASQKRPDRSAALKHAHAAAAYDTWFRAQIQASINDARPSIPDDEARVAFAKRKAGLRKLAS